MTAGLIYGQFNTAPATLGSGQQTPVQTDNQGRVLTVESGSSSPPTPPLTSAYTPLNTSFSSSGDNTVVAATASQTTRVFAIALTFATPVDVAIKDGAGTTLGVFQQITSLVLDPLGASPRYVTTANTAFIINLGAAVSAKGTIWYTKS